MKKVKMSLEDKVMTRLKVAMKEKDKAALRSLRAIKAAILLRKTDGSGTPVTDDEEIRILQKLVKQRKESMEIYLEQNRDDLAKTEKEEIEVLQQFLPAVMAEEELQAEVAEVIAEADAGGPQDMGKVMGKAQKRIAGRAEGRDVARVVKQQLQEKANQ